MSDESTTLNPKRTALLVMDFQVATVAGLEQPEPLLSRTADIIAKARDRGVVIAYVRMAFEKVDYENVPAHTLLAQRLAQYGSVLDADAPTTVINGTVGPIDGDIVVRKTRVGAFSSTDLDQQLRSRGVDTIVLAGITTSAVVLATTFDAIDHDYLVYVVSDLCADFQPTVHEFLTEQILPRLAHVVDAKQLSDLL